MFTTPEKYTLKQFFEMDWPPVILWAVPVLLGLTLIEFIASQIQNRHLYEKKDFFACVGVGIGHLISSALFKVAMFTIVWTIYYYVAPVVIPNVWWAYILCFIAIDFFRYWSHRIAHEQRFWWASHVTHHSSELYNFAVTFRLSWVQQVKVIFFLPVAAMGFDPVVFFICHQTAVLYQFWVHTELIRKMPRPIEFIFVTPSHHRVHHGTNPKYLDRNYGSSLIIWDRMFGTFQKEEEKVVYGITTPLNSYNPVYIVFHEYIAVFRDIKKAKSWKTRWEILISPPGTVFDEKTQALIYPHYKDAIEEEQGKQETIMDEITNSQPVLVHPRKVLAD